MLHKNIVYVGYLNTTILAEVSSKPRWTNAPKGAKRVDAITGVRITRVVHTFIDIYNDVHSSIEMHEYFMPEKHIFRKTVFIINKLRLSVSHINIIYLLNYKLKRVT